MTARVFMSCKRPVPSAIFYESALHLLKSAIFNTAFAYSQTRRERNSSQTKKVLTFYTKPFRHFGHWYEMSVAK